MARTEARILNSVWDDPDFRSLSPNAQWAYFFLLSQDDLTHLGVLPLRVRRWATKSANGMTVQLLADALRELERAHYIVADRDTEELLIRSLIRRDKIFKQPQVFRAAADALAQLNSTVLRAALAEELDRIAAEESMVAASQAILADMRAALAQAAPHPADHPAPHPESETEPECAPARPGERGVVTVVTTGGPVPRSPGCARGGRRADRADADRRVDRRLRATATRPHDRRGVEAGQSHARRRDPAGDSPGRTGAVAH